MTEAMFFAIFGPIAACALIMLVWDITTVIRGGYSIFTPPWVIMLDAHLASMRAATEMIKAGQRKAKS